MRTTLPLPAKHRARAGVRARALVFGIESQDNRLLLPVAALLLALLFIVAHVAALAGALILISASGLRAAGLRWLSHRRDEDLAGRAAQAAAASAATGRMACLADQVAVEAARTRRLPAPPTAAARSGRALPSLCLTPRLLAQRPLPARSARAAAA